MISPTLPGMPRRARLKRAPLPDCMRGPALTAPIEVRIPGLRLHNPLNSRQHWRVVWRRGEAEKSTVGMVLRSRLGVVPPALPVTITITKISTGRSDGDGLQASAKWVRDTCAKWLGVDDGSPLLTWQYAQRSEGRGVWGVVIRIEGRAA